MFGFCISLQNRRVALITNVKPGKLRDVMSEGLVLFSLSDISYLLMFPTYYIKLYIAFYVCIGLVGEWP